HKQFAPIFSEGRQIVQSEAGDEECRSLNGRLNDEASLALQAPSASSSAAAAADDRRRAAGLRGGGAGSAGRWAAVVASRNSASQSGRVAHFAPARTARSRSRVPSGSRTPVWIQRVKVAGWTAFPPRPVFPSARAASPSPIRASVFVAVMLF